MTMTNQLQLFFQAGPTKAWVQPRCYARESHHDQH